MSHSFAGSRTGRRARRIVAWVLAGALAASAVSLGRTVSAAASSATGYNDAVLADHPQYYYPLDESSGAVRDATGNVDPSTVNTAGLGVAGVHGTAASFDGVRQRVQVPYDPEMRLTDSFSIELWAKLPADAQDAGYPSLFSRGSGAPGRFGAAMWVSPDPAHLISFKRNGTNVPTARGLSSTAYRHLVFSWDATEQRYTWYVDGTPDVSDVLPALSGVDTETAPLSIGAFQDSPTTPAYYFGQLSIDGLAVYTHVLPADRVAAHYAAAAPAPPSSGPVTRRVGGIAVGGLQPWNTRRAADFAAWSGANATYVRTDIGWKFVQPTPSTWDWSLFDGVLADLQAHGLRYLAVLHTVPAWANDGRGDNASPNDLGRLAEYCYQTVRHYLPRGVVDYELGNEVNYAQPGWVPTGAHYARQFLGPCVSGARRAADELGRYVNLMFGSLAPGVGPAGGQEPVAFLTEAYAHGARGLTDSLAFHPYGGLNPAVEPNMVALPALVRAVMAANGDGTHPMWATEYGLPTRGPGSWSEQVQAEWIGAAYDTWAAHPHAGPMIWYAGRDSGTSSTEREQHFGILRSDGSPKPAYAALQARLTR